MALDIESFLEPLGLTYDKLKPEEKDWLYSKVNALATGQLTVDKIQQTIKTLRTQTEHELTTFQDTPQTMVSLLTLFLPVIGIIRKWYADQKKVELQARLKVYIALEIILTAPERQKKEIEDAVSNIVGGVG